MENALFSALEGQGIWTICCILLSLYVLKESKRRELDSINRERKITEDSQAREDKLMAHLDKTTEQHEKIAKSMESLERRMEYIENNLYKS